MSDNYPTCTTAPADVVIDILPETDSETRSGCAYTVLANKSTQTVTKTYCDASTEIVQHDRMEPSCRRNKQDELKDACMDATTRLSGATPRGYHWSMMMLVVMLRFVYFCVWKFNWTWTAAVVMASEIFEMDKKNVFHVAKAFRDHPDRPKYPAELATKTRGRGSEAFKTGPNAERFMVLKPHHLKTIVDYVIERNLTQRGMCNVHSIQSKLFSEYGILFKCPTIL